MTNYENTRPDIRPIDANALCEALKDWRGMRMILMRMMFTTLYIIKQ